MNTLSQEEMDLIQGGLPAAVKVAGCGALGLAAGLASIALGPLAFAISDLTTAGCIAVSL